MSINRLIEISRRSLHAAKAGMDTVSENVANANTEGYSRRRVNLRADGQSSPGPRMPGSAEGGIGTGVSVESFQRMRDQLLKAASWEAQSGLGSANEKSRILTSLEGILGTNGDGSLTSVLDKFWTSWSDVANNPTDRGARTALLSRASTVSDTLHHLDNNVDRLLQETETTLQQGVEDANGLFDKIASLNEQIRQARFKGSPDLAAEDQRDKLVKKLAGFAPVRVQDTDQGYTITINGMSVVQGSEVTPLEYDSVNQEIRFKGTGVQFSPPADSEGKLGAWLTLRTSTIPDVQNQLDGLAQNLVQQVNNAHTGGWDLNGNPGGDFFDASGQSAATIDVAVTDPLAVAASASASDTGDTTPAQNIAALRDTFARDVIGMTSGVGTQAERASARAHGQSAVVDHLDGMAKGVSGVSIDEEMTNLIEHQQAFAASARVLSTAKQMMDTLMRM